MPNQKISLKHPHDSFFKKLFDNKENIRDFLRVYLPKDLTKSIDFDSIKISDSEKENKKHKKYYLDLSVDCKIKDTNSQIYIIFEHKSYQDKLTLIQTLNYCLTIWENEIENGQKYLTPIIPFIFYHGKTKSKLKKNFKEYFKKEDNLTGYLMDFKFIIFDTTQIENNDIIQNINNLYLSASLLLMKNIFRDIKELKPMLEYIIKVDDDRVIRLFEYIVVNKDIEKDELTEIINEVKGADKIMTLAQRWLEEGKQEGIQIGIFETAIVMMEKLNHSIDEIVKVLNIKKEELIAYMENKSNSK